MDHVELPKLGLSYFITAGALAKVVASFLIGIRILVAHSSSPLERFAKWTAVALAPLVLVACAHILDLQHRIAFAEEVRDWILGPVMAMGGRFLSVALTLALTYLSYAGFDRLFFARRDHPALGTLAMFIISASATLVTPLFGAIASFQNFDRTKLFSISLGFVIGGMVFIIVRCLRGLPHFSSRAEIERS